MYSDVCRLPTDDPPDDPPVASSLYSPPDSPLIAPSCHFPDSGPELPAPGSELFIVASQLPVPGSPLPAPTGEAEDRGFPSRCGKIFATTRDDVFRDYTNYYTLDTLGEFTVALAPAAVFANTDWDADVGNWYQEHVRSNATNRAASFFRPLGNGYYTIPVYVSAKLLGEYFDDQPGMPLLGEFGDRTTRALLVGASPLLAVQYLTGGGRPSDSEDESYWRPFHGSNGASGHAFMGAVPFLTLAGMTDDPLAKCFFYACSPWTGISRINDNLHYLSQVWLAGGWPTWPAMPSTRPKKEKARC